MLRDRKTKITVFQALTLLAEQYGEKNPGWLQHRQIMGLYLSGVRSDNDIAIIGDLLRNPILVNYTVSKDPEDITNDPVRRYFESHLCIETLKHSLDDLNKDLLYKNSCYMAAKLSRTYKDTIPLAFPGDYGKLAKKASNNAPEYIAMFNSLKDPESFQFLAPKDDNSILSEHKNKLVLIGKSVYAAMSSVSLNDSKFPINIYSDENSPYDVKHRGVTKKKFQEDVRSNNLGIMCSSMPLPRSDPLFSESQAGYVRVVENATYNLNSSEPQNAFATLVTPFVSSISGTMLCQLMVIAKLCHEDKFVFKGNKDQTALYFKNLVSFMILHSGGHSLDEFMRVFKIPVIQEEFKNIPGFTDITLEQLFQKQNAVAFEKAIAQSIEYNKQIIKRSCLREGLHGYFATDKTTVPAQIKTVLEDDILTFAGSLLEYEY
jgi:hypothetical protein